VAKVSGTFFGESRLFAYPMMDFNGVAPLTPVTPTIQGAPLQLTDELGDNSTSWRIYGHSAVMPTAAAGGLPDLTPVNLQIKRQDTGELWVRDNAQSAAPATNISLGAPLEHLAGKAGNPAYMSYAWDTPAGTRLIPIVAHQAVATPTGRSPLYLVAHATLARGNAAARVQLGSKNKQQMTYRGHWTSFTARLNYAANNLPINASDQITMQISTRQYFFVDSLWCRAITNVDAGPNIWLPNSPFNPQVNEDEILVSLKDTTQRTPYTVNGYVPLWTMFGQWGSRYYHPPSMFVVRPNGNLELDIQNGPTTPITYNLEFTVGGVLVDKPTKQITQQLEGM